MTGLRTASTAAPFSDALLSALDFETLLNDRDAEAAVGAVRRPSAADCFAGSLVAAVGVFATYID
jgi:hypothetical protein